MATGSILTISNRALGSIGARANVQSLNENSAESNACNTFYQSTFESLARSAKWNCLRKQAGLTLVAAAPGTPENINGATTPYPPNPWFYSYLVPSDSLFVRQILPPPQVLQNNGVPIFPVNNYSPFSNYAARYIRFEVSYGTDSMGNAAEVINTNQTQAQCIYTVNQPNPAYWDSLFQQAMVASLAAFLVPALSLDKQLMQIQIGAAKAMIDQARALDGNEGTISQNREAEWITARNGSSGPLGVGYNTSTVNYEIAWPV